LTKTIQLYSSVAVNDTGRADKPEADNLRFLASLSDDLNNLSEELNHQNYILKNTKQIIHLIHRKHKGGNK
jgi:hypothetical protein